MVDVSQTVVERPEPRKLILSRYESGMRLTRKGVGNDWPESPVVNSERPTWRRLRAI